jgi:hypothetical protein
MSSYRHNFASMMAAFKAGDERRRQQQQTGVAFVAPPANVGMTKERRKVALSSTPLGRQVLRDEAAKDPARVTVSGLAPARRRALLSASSWGRSILAEEERARR